MAKKEQPKEFPCPRCGKIGTQGWRNNYLANLIWRMAQKCGFYRNGQVFVSDLCAGCYTKLVRAFKAARKDRRLDAPK